MSLKPGLCHLHLVDGNYGAGFAQLGQIRHPLLKVENVNSSMLLEELKQELERRKTPLTRIPTI